MSINKLTLRMLARRALELKAEVSAIDTIFEQLVVETAPALAVQLAARSTRPEGAS